MARLQQPFYLGPYRVIAELGAGGFATVYRAVVEGDMGFARDVALKVLHPHLTANDAEIVKMLADEARLLARMQHPNIVYVQWFGQLQHPSGAQVFAMMMEFVEGQSFRDLMAEENRKLPLSVVLDVHLDVARALAFAHTLKDERGVSLGLVHRDLKPDNVMISHQGVIKLLDFGIAKASDRIAQNTKTDFLRGTVHYMSPEQVAGERNLDFRSDLFSFGAMLWESLVGRRLIASDSVIAALHAVATFEAEEALDEVEAQHPQAAPILRKLLPRDRDERYASTDELVADLETLRRSVTGQRPTAAWLRDRVANVRAETAAQARASMTGELGETLDINQPAVVAGAPPRGGGAFAPASGRTGSSSPAAQPPFTGTAAHAATAAAAAALAVEEEAGATRMVGRPGSAPPPFTGTAAHAATAAAAAALVAEEEAATTRMVGRPGAESGTLDAPALDVPAGGGLGRIFAVLAAVVGVLAVGWVLRPQGGGAPSADPAPPAVVEPAPSAGGAAVVPAPVPEASSSGAGPGPAVAEPAAVPASTPPTASASPSKASVAGSAPGRPAPAEPPKARTDPAPAPPAPTPAPAAVVSSGPPGRLRVSSAHLFDVAVGPKQFNQLEARKGIELPPGTHQVRVICLDCTGAVTEVVRPVEIRSGETSQLPDVKF